MNAKSAALIYRQSTFENAPPIKIVRLLYEGALRYIDRAETQLTAGQPGWASWVARADAIVEELRLALDQEQDPQTCQQLDALYEYVLHRLAVSVAERSPEPLREARRVVATLNEAWRDIEARNEQAV